MALLFVLQFSIFIKCFLLFQGLKTGMYYLRTKPAANAIQFTVDKTKVSQAANGTSRSKDSSNGMSSDEKNMADMVCSLENKDACLSCGS